METPRDDQLAADLKALRPTPRPEFRAELDERAAAGFPRRSRLPRLSFGPLRAIPARRLVLAGGAFALFAIVVASTLVVANQGGSEPQDDLALLEPHSKPAQSSPDPPDKSAAAGGSNSAPQGSSGIQYETEVPTTGSEASSAAAGTGYSAAAPEIERLDADRSSGNSHRRAVERSAEIVLAAEPGDVGEDSSEVFEVVHAHDGIVMSSSSREGKPGQAGARFELLLPSDDLGDSLAALSEIDEVRSRHEATTDITAPTVDTAELLRDSNARIDSLLAQLESAETEGEREAVEAELQQERRHRARLRGNLQHLEHRASYSRVLLLIETGAKEESGTGGGTWGVGDALGDAGQILAVAAAVAVVGLAILGPIALIALLAWLTHRAWVRRERRRVLS
ncbi:MAG TPA: DUF4349 domain-containing protein [Solirubrobacterales bacterium]|nr:DUF4349 domain-containing protein [Solirubrobacterales bacterium]